MKFSRVLLTVLALFLLSFGMPKNLQKKVEKVIKNTYQTENFTLEPKSFEAETTSNLPAVFSDNNFFRVLDSEKLLGYVYVSKAPSKTDSFDYLILLNKNLTIEKAKVLVYREDYGGEIGSKRWLKQFIGKSPKDELRYQDNIVAISGATISVRSMTTAVNDLLKSLHILQTNKYL